MLGDQLSFSQTHDTADVYLDMCGRQRGIGNLIPWVELGLVSAKQTN